MNALEAARCQVVDGQGLVERFAFRSRAPAAERLDAHNNNARLLEAMNV